MDTNQPKNLDSSDQASEPVETTSEAPKETTSSQPKEEDLVSRVAQFQETNQPKPQDVDFNITDIEKIQDPQAREYAEKAYKSFQKGWNQKFQEIAGLRKELEKARSDTSNWTKERLQKELNNPEFVQVAQEVAGVNQQQATDDYSALSEADKKQISNIRQQMLSLNQQNAQLLRKQQDETLKTKYANYNPESVDIITNDLLKGQRQATREDIWKVKDYEDAVKRAYQMGLQDKKIDTQEKASAFSPEGRTAVPSSSLEAEKGESDRAFLKRIFEKNIKKTPPIRT